MKKCPYCQKGNDDEEIQCWNCGEWFETVSPPKQRNVVKPPKKEQSVTYPVDWQTKLGGVFKKYIIPIMSIIIIAEILFAISQIANFNKNAEQVAGIEPAKIDTPAVAPAPEAESNSAPQPAPAPEYGVTNNLLNNAFALCSSGKCTDPQKAIEYLNDAIKLKPDLAMAYNNRGKAYGDLGQHEQAITDYNEAIRLKPDYADAYYNRGKDYDDLGQHQQAITDYNEAIRLKPDYAHAYNNRGVAYFIQGNKSLGCSDAQKACDLGYCQLLEWAKDKKFCL
jgi:tetratricopeptide (TPR) repeat protein